MRRLIESSRFDRAQQQALCADDYWAYFRKCRTPRDEIIEGIRYSEMRYREVGARKEDDWHFMQNVYRADYLDAYEYLLRFDVKDIAERIEALADKIDAIEWLPRALTVTERMLQLIYRQRINGLLHLLNVTIIRWSKHQEMGWRGVIQEILQEYVTNGLAASRASHHLHDLRRADKDLEVSHVTRL